MKYSCFEPAPDTRPVFARCCVCGEMIRAGDVYYDVGGDYMHKDCADELPREELLGMLGVREETA